MRGGNFQNHRPRHKHFYLGKRDFRMPLSICSADQPDVYETFPIRNDAFNDSLPSVSGNCFRTQGFHSLLSWLSTNFLTAPRPNTAFFLQ